MANKFRFVVNSALAKFMRLDAVLAAALPDLSRRSWRGAIDAGCLRKNGDTTRVQGKLVDAGDVVDVDVVKLASYIGNSMRQDSLVVSPSLRIYDDVDDATVLRALLSTAPIPAKETSLVHPITIPAVCVRAPPIDVLSASQRLLVVNKPSGVLCTAPGYAAPTNTLEQSNFGTPVSTPPLRLDALRYNSMPLDEQVAWWLAHDSTLSAPSYLSVYQRIDAGASGAVLFVRTRAMAPLLDAAWGRNGIEWRHIAVVQVRAIKRTRYSKKGFVYDYQFNTSPSMQGVPPWTSCVMRDPIGRVFQDGRDKFGVTPAGRAARTTARVLATGRGFAVVEVTANAPRAHQFRVHLEHSGHPVVGDVLYGADSVRWTVSPPQAGTGAQRETSPVVPRILLHSHRIAFDVPIRHELVRAEAPIPADIAAWYSAATTLLADL